MKTQNLLDPKGFLRGHMWTTPHVDDVASVGHHVYRAKAAPPAAPPAAAPPTAPPPLAPLPAAPPTAAPPTAAPPTAVPPPANNRNLFRNPDFLSILWYIVALMLLCICYSIN